MESAEARAVKIYTPESRLHHPWLLLKEIRRDFKAGNELAWQLVKKDLNAQYRQSFLGIVWAFVAPAISAITWIVLNGTGIIKISETEVPYPVFVLTGTLLWGIFTEAFDAPLGRTTDAKSMLTKINFPKESLILAGIYQTVINSGIKIILMLAAVFIIGVYPSWQIVFFPFAIFSLVLFGTAIGALLTPIRMLFADISRLIPVVLMVVMYLSPVLYPVPKNKWIAFFFNINPLTYLITTARNLITGFTPEHLPVFILINCVAILIFIIAIIIYKAVMPVLIERMSV
ncbi:MAG TPA: ABC transporter permease [Bacteroidia bacterium]|nr:ABC transporter permease [Bacteroidia bacterium]